MAKRWKRSRLACLIMREDNPNRFDVPALLVLSFYIGLVLLLASALVYFGFMFRRNGW